MSKVKSFGEHLKSCNIPPPKLARAIGVHLTVLENAMRYNNPTDEMLERLQQVSEKDNFHGGAPLKVSVMKWWINAYNAAHPDNRETTVYRDWVEPEIATTVPTNLPEGFASWALVNPLTFKAYQDAHPRESNEMAAMTLNALRLKCYSELVGGRPMQVWRWNPLDLPKAMGGPPQTALISRTDEDIFISTHNRKVAKAKLILRDIVAITSEAFAKLLQGRVPSSSAGLQKIRNVLTDVGWEYNQSKKFWTRKIPT